MYKIGEFSMLNQVTIKTLRYYDEINLFKPKIVDKFTGYRYYDDVQDDEFKEIIKYKSLGFSLDEIKVLKENKDENIIKNKIQELDITNKDNDHKINTLKNIIGDDNMINVEYKEYWEKYIVGKRITLNKRNDFNTQLKNIESELNKIESNKFSFNLVFEKGNKVLCNFELGYEKESIDAFIGFQVSNLDKINSMIRNGETNLEVMMLSKNDKFLVSESTIDDIDNAYSKIIKYAKENNIQIRGWFTEVYKENAVEIYISAFKLDEMNSDYEFHLNKYNSNKLNNKINKALVGTYSIREILPSIKYMFNPLKQKSMLDTKYNILELKKDGKTNYENITWNEKELIIKYNNIFIPLPIYITEIDGKRYLKVLMNETLEYYKSQRPLQYLYKKIK